MINKEALAALIAAQTNNAEFTADMIDDNMMAGLINVEEQETEVEENEEADTEVEETEEETDETPADEEEGDDLEGIDPNNLSPTERMFYDYIQKEKQKAKSREISLIIQGSQLDIKHKMILDRMAKDGVPRKSIEATIEDFKQIQASSARVGGTTKIVSKSKMKGTTTKKPDVPKMGTKDFGKYLAELRKTKKI